MEQKLTAQQIKEHFRMTPLDKEGGLVCQTYISDEILPERMIPGRNGDHTICSAILYMISGEGYSRMHRLPTEEIFHFYLGDPVEMLLLYPDGSGKIIRMGQDILHGEVVQFTVPRGCWQGTRLVKGGSWALLGTSMAPGFAPQDYEDGVKADLQIQYPQFAELLELYAGKPVYT